MKSSAGYTPRWNLHPGPSGIDILRGILSGSISINVQDRMYRVLELGAAKTELLAHFPCQIGFFGHFCKWSV